LKPFFVYMLRCSDGSFYVGHTDELERRVAEHRAGEGAAHTRTRLPVDLVWMQETAGRDEALAAEKRVQGWSRAKKEALVRGDWGAIQRHAWGTRNPLPDHLKDGAGASIPQPERAGWRANKPTWEDGPMNEPTSVRPEVSKGQSGHGMSEASIPQPERVVGDERGPASVLSREPISVRPEVSKGSLSPSMDMVDALKPGILANHRRPLAKAITLLESTRPDHRKQADALLNAILPHTGKAIRIGISGVPGVGKSTFIEALGLALIDKGHQVAVLAIDPSSTISGGSILGDKTRMERLSMNEQAFIRPSPSSGTLGGVAEKTRETMLVCEAAGYDVVIVETVGVGQSETAVARMTDLFVLLQLPNAGDELQAIKRGVMELADLVVINKADLDPDAATRARAQITSAMRIYTQHGDPHEAHATRVMQLSALKAEGIDTFWQLVLDLKHKREANGEFQARRQQQAKDWMWDLIHARLLHDFREHPAVREALPTTLQDVLGARLAPSAAARALLDRYRPT
jgi:LAO/AO transport system kinase